MDLQVVLAVAASYYVGSVIKGVLGMGALLVAIPVLTFLIGPTAAVALMVVPSFVANTWQFFESGNFLWAVRRFWPLVATSILGTAIGASLLVTLDPHITAAVIGSAIIFFCITRFLNFQPTLGARGERWVAPPLGLVTGVLGGATMLSGSFVVMFLVAIRVGKDQFVTAIALVYMTGSLTIFGTLSYHDQYDLHQLAASAALVIPGVLGLMTGRRIRARIPLEVFMRVVTGALFLAGVSLIWRAFG